jgi:hypothetical protein
MSALARHSTTSHERLAKAAVSLNRFRDVMIRSQHVLARSEAILSPHQAVVAIRPGRCGPD